MSEGKVDMALVTPSRIKIADWGVIVGIAVVLFGATAAYVEQAGRAEENSRRIAVLEARSENRAEKTASELAAINVRLARIDAGMEFLVEERRQAERR